MALFSFKAFVKRIIVKNVGQKCQTMKSVRSKVELLKVWIDHLVAKKIR